MKPNSIIVIQVGSMSGMEANDFFDDHGIKRNKDYTFFRNYYKGVLDEVSSNVPQLVFTSHVDGSIDSRQVASEIKEKNPLAIVFALTHSEVPKERGSLDGVIDKDLEPQDFTARLTKLFLAGRPSSQLIRAVKEFEKPV